MPRDHRTGFPRRRLGAAALSALLLVLFVSSPGARATSHLAAGMCWGPLLATPAAVPVGGTLTLSGAHYRCTAPSGALLSQAAIILYHPGLGFAIFTAHVRPNGTYTLSVRVPARLTAESAINGGPNRSVATAPGAYYLAVRLFDVSLPPPSQADARVTVLPAPASPATPRAPMAPSAAEIAAVMARTVEVSHRATHFAPSGRPLTIDDGRGTGTLTAVVGARIGGGGTLGQLTFFWHNATFLGWDAGYETARVLRLASPGAGAFAITYARYRAGDAACCPSLPPVEVQSGWSGTILISNGVPPPTPGAPLKVTLLR